MCPDFPMMEEGMDHPMAKSALIKKEAGEEKSGTTADRIITAAREVFAEKGYSGTHMDAIARRAGVNKATLYYQIGDKDTLYASVIHQVLGNVARNMADAVNAAGHPREKLGAYIGTIAHAVDKNPELPSIMLREVASDGAHLPRVAAQDMATVVTILAGIIEGGKRKGIFEDVTPFLVHCMIMGTILIYKKASPIKDRQLWLPVGVKRYDKILKDSTGQAVAKLVFKAIQKGSGGK